MTDDEVDSPGTVWVRTVRDAARNGRYYVELTYGPDWAVTLDPDLATQHATHVLFAVADAMHAASFATVIGGLDGDGEGGPTSAEVADVIRTFVASCPESPTAPTEIELHGMLLANGEPALGVFFRGERVGRLTAEDATEHAAGVMAAVRIAELDTVLFAYLTDELGLTEPTADALIASMSTHPGAPTA